MSKKYVTYVVVVALIIIDIIMGLVIYHLSAESKSQKLEISNQQTQIYQLQSENNELKQYRDEYIVKYFSDLLTTSELVVNENNIYSEIVPLSEDLQIYTYNKCIEYDVPYSILLGLIEQESDFNANEISSTNDYGLCQINKCNFTFLSDAVGMTDIMDPYQNIECGIYMLHFYKETYSPNDPWNVTLVQYNMGPNGAKKYFNRGIYETAYSRAVLEKAQKYENL